MPGAVAEPKSYTPSSPSVKAGKWRTAGGSSADIIMTHEAHPIHLLLHGASWVAIARNGDGGGCCCGGDRRGHNSLPAAGRRRCTDRCARGVAIVSADFAVDLPPCSRPRACTRGRVPASTPTARGVACTPAPPPPMPGDPGGVGAAGRPSSSSGRRRCRTKPACSRERRPSRPCFSSACRRRSIW